MIAHDREKFERIREILLKDVEKKRQRQLSRLDQELKAQEEKGLAEARKEAEALQAEAREEAARIRKLSVAQARYKKDRELMKAREDKVVQIIGELEQRLLAFRREEGYPLLLKKLIQEAVKEIGDRELILHFNEEDTALYKEKLEWEIATYFQEYSLEVGSPIRDCTGGVVVRNIPGTRRVENTLGSLLKEIREQVGKDLYRQFMQRNK